ncbi:MAG: DEAD/DEAH box helicase family protein [Candidatus Methanomethylophilaceae archaeon]|jgi:Fanconi anemia group M protein|nr:DEAD/DEAH box helicase family protein [Candidatus Methanomethylophilaceae archaeon]
MSFVSHPRIIPDRVEERKYQTAMVQGCLGCNTLVILPTGLGKTVVALRVAAEFLSAGKVLILAPTKPLVDQHSRFFSEMLSGTVVSVMTGAMKPQSRAELVEASDVVISTPQCVANDLESARYDLDGFSLVIYDEAHRGVGNYSYVTVAEHCWSGMRSVGMTASPGSDYERIKEVCCNLDLRRIDIKSDDDPDVSPYVFDTYVNRIEVNIPPDLVKVSAILRAMLDRYTEELISLGLMDRGWPASTKHMLMIGASLQTRISHGERSPVVFKGLSLQAVCIKLLHAINMAETQGMTALRIYMDKLVQESKTEKGGKAAKTIVGDALFPKLARVVRSTNAEHPKISKAMSLVSMILSDDPDSKVLVFSQYRDTCDLLVSKLSLIPSARVGKLVGQANGGLKQKDQIELLTRFRSGEYNVVVSTSVGEEGLDVSSTNAVIFYEPVPSEIRTIQRRGRTGRKNDGEVYVLIAKGTMDEVFDRSSKRKEDDMRARLERLSEELSRQSPRSARRQQSGLGDFDQ